MAVFYHDVRTRYSGLFRSRPSLTSRDTVSMSPLNAAKVHYAEIEDGMIQGSNTTIAEGVKGPRQSFEERNYPLNSIRVNKTVAVV